MTWTLTDDLDDYLAAAGGFVRSRPVQHTLQLSVVETLRARGASAFGEPAPGESAPVTTRRDIGPVNIRWIVLRGRRGSETLEGP